MLKALHQNTIACQKLPLTSDWAVLIEHQNLNFAQLNSLNCHSQAWTLSQGKPLIYNQIAHLIKCGFKNFVIALFHIDKIVKHQIDQLKTLYKDCTFKCLQVNDSWFFENQQILTRQAEKYLQHSVHLFLKRDKKLGKNPIIWIQKIESHHINPFDYIENKTEKNCSMLWLNTTNSQKKLNRIGLWLNIEILAEHYQNRLKETHKSQQGFTIIRNCITHIYQNCQDVFVSSDSSSRAVHTHEDALVASRCFNQVSIDTEKGIVIKHSTETAKLQQEIDFYRQLPEHLKIYFPRMLGTGRMTDTTSPCSWYSLEYYPYKSLSQYFVYYALPLETWQTIFKRLLNVHQQFAQPDENHPKLDSQALYEFYTQKLTTRLATAKQNPKLAQIIEMSSIRLNGQSLKGLKVLQPWLNQRISALCKDVSSGFVHGDLCFSNILLEPASHVIRLIDPRGDFMGSVNRGDPRYDLAKILHSLHGRYDFMINDLFTLQRKPSGFELQTPQSDYLGQLYSLFIEQIQTQTQYKLNDLLLLESLLFLTMLPLHHDQPQRQIAFLLTGLQLLNQVYQDEQQRLPSFVEKHSALSAERFTQPVAVAL